MLVYQIWCEGPLLHYKRSKEISSIKVYKTYEAAHAAAPEFVDLCCRGDLAHDPQWIHYNIIALEVV